MSCLHLFFICEYYENNQWNYMLALQPKVWEEAWEYCRANFYSLITLRDGTRLKAEVDQDIPVWIGLSREGKATATNTPSRL